MDAGCSVLLAEDDLSQRQALRELLVALGFDVRECANGDELHAAILEASLPFVVLSDLWMPGRSIFEIVEELRRESVLEVVPILVISGDGGYFRMAYPELEFLPKPVDVAKLSIAVNRLADEAHRSQPRRARAWEVFQRRVRKRRASCA